MSFSEQAEAAIGAFNAGDRDGAKKALGLCLSAFEADNEDARAILPFALALRIIAFQVRDVARAVQIDAVLQPLMGEGIRQFDADQDTAIRTDINTMIALVNEGRLADAADAVRDFLARYDDGRKIHHAQLDCLEALNNLCRQPGMDGVAAVSEAVMTALRVQELVHDSNKQLFPSVDTLAIDFPYMVTIETFSKCNAKCTFCPYPMLEAESDRSNVKMPDERFHKIIDDLKDIPASRPLTLNLSRVNEPLLDSRIYHFMELIEKELPGRPIILPSNGSTLTKKNIERLASLKPFHKLYVSMNSDDPDTYEETMGIPFDRTVANLDRLHTMKSSGEVPFSVSLTAVMPTGAAFDRYQAWCRERFPLFEVGRYPPTNWFGLTGNQETEPLDIPALCKDWYQVHILADGTEAQCCFDAMGQFGEGNIDDHHLLDLYNKPWQRDLRRFGTQRQSELSPGFCQDCWYM